MNDALRAEVFEAIDDVGGHELSHLGRELSMVGQKIGEVTVECILKEHVVVLLVSPGRLQLHYVRVAQRLHDLHFILDLLLYVLSLYE